MAHLWSAIDNCGIFPITILTRWVKEYPLVHPNSNCEYLVAPEEVYPAELRDEMIIEIVYIKCHCAPAEHYKILLNLTSNNKLRLDHPHIPITHHLIQGYNLQLID